MGPHGPGRIAYARVRAQGNEGVVTMQLAAYGLLTAAFSNVMYWLLMALTLFKVFTFVDAAFRREDAFRAAGKQTKPFWLIILGVAVGIDFFLGALFLSLIGLVAAIVYMVDVRPAVKRVSPSRKGRNGQKKQDHMGPYGPW
ncbi:DUF2516 family protein [Streptacidiphilus rugosus]|uniref:DUF2516 family protein n=1 Tax=Streptacidiphilus rugosus TaxID=405783 RepID=UPI001E3BE684|nr:DUF2516 family protein [Streptacidiphilus rugosus]